MPDILFEHGGILVESIRDEIYGSKEELISYSKSSEGKSHVRSDN